MGESSPLPQLSLGNFNCHQWRLQELYADDELQFHGQLSPLLDAKNFQALVREATRQKWVVYAKRPFAGPQQVLAYLSRYTHRVAISPRRLLALDTQRQTVTFAWKDYANGQKQKTMTLGLGEFVRRFSLYILPERFVKIRHYGFLSNRLRQTKVAQARALFSKENQIERSSLCCTDPPTAKSAPPPARACPHCGSDQLRLIQIIPPQPQSTPSRLDSS